MEVLPRKRFAAQSACGAKLHPRYFAFTAHESSRLTKDTSQPIVSRQISLISNVSEPGAELILKGNSLGIRSYTQGVWQQFPKVCFKYKAGPILFEICELRESAFEK